MKLKTNSKQYIKSQMFQVIDFVCRRLGSKTAGMT